jgi:hypothetical protein
MSQIISQVFQVLTYVDITFFLVLTVFLIYNIKKLPSALKIFSYFEFVVFVIAASALIMAKLYINNTLLFHLLLVIQLIWLSTHYYLIFSGTIISKIVLWVSGTFFLILAWQYSSDWKGQTDKFGGVLYFISTLLYVIYAIMFYANMLTGKVKPKYPLINAAILIYYSSTSVIFLFSKYYYLEGFEGQMILWIFNVLLHMLFVILIFADVWKALFTNKKNA